MGLNGAAFACDRGAGRVDRLPRRVLFHRPHWPRTVRALQQQDAAVPSHPGSDRLPGTESGGIANPSATDAPTPRGASTSQEAGSGAGGQADESESAASWESRQVSLRPRNNVAAHDPMDHWGHRQTGAITARLTGVKDTASGLAGFGRLLDAARAANPEWSAPTLKMTIPWRYWDRLSA